MYNPSEAGKKGTIFGLPYSLEEADLIFLPVHLDTTVSYADGTAKAPSLILDESSQLDLSLVNIHQPWTLKMAIHPKIVEKSQNEIHRARAKTVIKAIEAGKKVDLEQVQFVNEFCEKVHAEIERISTRFINEDKILGIIGGDHSSPLGLINAIANKYEFGVLQIDAHMDLRKAYEGFEFSHASIMYNALKNKSVTKLVQVGIRDFCEEEEDRVKASDDRIKVFFDYDTYLSKEAGVSFLNQAKKMVGSLPELVYISFDMDGLQPSLCPNTGTPVPGGLSFNESETLIAEIVESGRKIIGFDVCETGNHVWDANVASRILFRLATYTGVSNGLLQFR